MVSLQEAWTLQDPNSSVCLQYVTHQEKVGELTECTRFRDSGRNIRHVIGS